MTANVAGYIRDAAPDEWPDRYRPEWYRVVVVDALVHDPLKWRTASPGRHCRAWCSNPRRICGAPAVVELHRSHSGSSQGRWWGYCADPEHLYGRRWENGQLLDAVLVEDSP